MQHENHASGVNPYAVAAPSANPYAAPTARIEQHVEQSGDFALASRGARLGAAIIDNVLFLLCFGAFIFAALGRGPRTAGGLAMLGVIVGVVLVVTNLVMLHRSGQSIGKRLVGIRIVRSDGSRCSLGRIVGLRILLPALMSAIPYIGRFFNLVDALAIFREERRCIHDHFADTIVVDA